MSTSDDAVSTWDSTDQSFHVPESAGHQEMDEAVRAILVNSIWVGLLALFLLAMVVTSTRQHRKGPIFYILLLSFFMALTSCCLKVAWGVYHIRIIFIFPQESVNIDLEFHLHDCPFALDKYISLLADSTLILKVLPFFPFPIYGLRVRILVVSPMIILLLVRTALVARYSAETWGLENTDMVWLRIWRHMEALEFMLQVIYCSYGSAILFRRALLFYKSSATVYNTSVRCKTRFFIESVFFTYLIPVAFQLASIFDLYITPGYKKRYIIYSEVNTYTSVICALLSTSWSTIRNKAGEVDSQKSNSPQPSFQLTSTLFGELYLCSDGKYDNDTSQPEATDQQA